jgi:putative endonuclease
LTDSVKNWNLYLLRCADGSLYTGITTDVDRRFGEHQDVDGKGKGAKALRGKRPLTVVFSEPVKNRSEALKLEYRVKQLSKVEKEKFILGKAGLKSLVLKQT